MRLIRYVTLPIILVLAVLLLIGCAQSENETPSSEAISSPEPTSVSTQQEPEVEVPTVAEAIPPAPNIEDKPAYKTGDASYIFDQNKLHTFELTLSEKDLAFLDEQPGREEYVEGTLTFEGEMIGTVGIRYKGSVGAWVFCVSGDFFQAEGEKTCTKLSMKVKINWKDSDDTFFGLKKLQFHSQNLDPTKMHERLGYWLFREMGVPAPRSVHARLVINGEYNGIFALTEQIDGRFTRENFDDGTGNLYKEIWPINSEGRTKTDGEYQRALKTNEDEDPGFDLIRGFGAEIASAEEQDRQSIMDTWVNMDQVLAYAIVDRAIANDDGVFHWYCGEISGLGIDRDAQTEDVEAYGCNPHNYYWYEDPTAKTMHLIPWDLDNAFEVIKSQSNPVIPIKDGWGETTNECRPFVYGAWGLAQRSAACDIIIGTWVEYKDKHESMLEEFMNGPFSKEVIEELLDTWAVQIEDAVTQAAMVHDDQPEVTEWRRALDEFKGDLEYAREQ
jgi:spore coat protein CotH